MSTLTVLFARPERSLRARRAARADHPLMLPTVVVLAAGLLSLAGVGNVRLAAEKFPFGIPAIFLGLSVFTAMVSATGIGDALAVRLAKTSRGERSRTLIFGVIVLLATCALGNNLVHVGLVLPVLLLLTGTVSSDRRYLVAFFSCVMAIVNCAGAATPVGDFPALTIMASHITSFGAYLGLAFPLFAGVTSVGLVLVYLVILHFQGHYDKSGTEDEVPASAGAVLLEAMFEGANVDKKSLARLLLVLAAMFALWVGFPAVPSWAVAWAGAAVGATVAPNVRDAVRLDRIDLVPAVRISAFLGGASFVATTGLLRRAGALQSEISQPRLLLVALMVVAAVVTALLSAGPAAAVLLPVAQELVGPQAVLAGRGALVAVAFAAGVCAGSSAFVLSATAGPLISRKVEAAHLRLDNGETLRFSTREYMPFGLVNAIIQLGLAVPVILILFQAGVR